MTCPKCNEKTIVIDSITDEDSTTRRRKCLECDYRFTTVEIDKDLYERLVKHNDKRQRVP
jgi:transcriptional regulator NrdR family protein